MSNQENDQIVKNIIKATNNHTKLADYNNQIIEWTNNQLINYFDKLSIASSAIVTLALGLLSTIFDKKQQTINEYSVLLIFGVICLLFTFISGIVYRYLFVKAKWNKVREELGDSFIKVMEEHKKGLTAKILVEIDGDDSYPDENIKKITPTTKEHKKKFEFYNKVANIIEFLSPITYLFGIILTAIYFLIQFFDF